VTCKSGPQAGVEDRFLDEAIGRAVNILHPDAWGVTAELTVRFKRPVPLGSELRAIARVTKDSRRLYEGTAEIVLADGTVAVEASGKYVKIPIDQIAEGDFGSEWVADVRGAPARVEL
jgi:acyl-coenzyme A thioesterase PaaI-like protein